MYPTKQITPFDSEIDEEWIREIADPREKSIHGVGAAKSSSAAPWYWNVSVWAMEHVRGAPLEIPLRRLIMEALRAVPGVVEAVEEDREVWLVRGEPRGAALVDAVALVVDAGAEDIAAYLRA